MIYSNSRPVLDQPVQSQWLFFKSFAEDYLGTNECPELYYEILRFAGF